MARSLVVYYPGKTFIHRLDPRAKIVFLVLISTAVFAIQNIYISAFILATMIFLWSLARLPVSVVTGFLRALLPVFLFLMVVQAIFYPGETYLIRPIIPNFVPVIGGMGKVSLEGIVFSVLLMFRLLAMVIMLPLVSMTTPVHIFALGLVRMGLPYRLAYTATTALNLVPVLQNEAGVIIDAQRLRAMQTFEKGRLFDKLRAYPALVTPLVIGAMRHAQSIAVAMDSRAFGASKSRTYIDDIQMQPVDWAFIVLTAAYTFGVIAAAVILK
jgi:energy-coupling factor transport system permease protein